MSSSRTLAIFRRPKDLPVGRLGWLDRRSPVRYAGLLMCLALGGCGGPSGDDIKASLQEASIGLLGERMAPVFEKVTDVDCKEAQGKPGYICTFNATSFSKMMNARSSQVGEGRFVQSDSKWVIMADK